MKRSIQIVAYRIAQEHLESFHTLKQTSSKKRTGWRA